jgi:hypothetical protein
MSAKILTAASLYSASEGFGLDDRQVRIAMKASICWSVVGVCGKLTGITLNTILRRNLFMSQSETNG